MSKTITIVTGSARPNSAGVKILPIVKEELEKVDGVNVQVASLGEIGMPFIDSEIIPANEDFVPKHDSVKNWQKIVQDSDGIIWLTPEYNNQISPIQKNAFDWLYRDWENKPISLIGYSWSGAKPVVELLQKLITKVGAKPMPTTAHLLFTKDIDFDGSMLDEAVVREKIAATVKELAEA